MRSALPVSRVGRVKASWIDSFRRGFLEPLESRRAVLAALSGQVSRESA